MLFRSRERAGLPAAPEAEPVVFPRQQGLMGLISQLQAGVSARPGTEQVLEELRGLAEENASLRQTLQNRKVIERAKGVLMKRHRWTEAEAFRRLQRGAMNRRVAMVELAQEVLNGTVTDL